MGGGGGGDCNGVEVDHCEWRRDDGENEACNDRNGDKPAWEMEYE